VFQAVFDKEVPVTDLLQSQDLQAYTQPARINNKKYSTQNRKFYMPKQ